MPTNTLGLDSVWQTSGNIWRALQTVVMTSAVNSRLWANENRNEDCIQAVNQ